MIYNGNFESILIKGSGICASLLKENKIKVFNENELKELNECINA